MRTSPTSASQSRETGCWCSILRGCGASTTPCSFSSSTTSAATTTSAAARQPPIAGRSNGASATAGSQPQTSLGCVNRSAIRPRRQHILRAADAVPLSTAVSPPSPLRSSASALARSRSRPYPSSSAAPSCCGRALEHPPPPLQLPAHANDVAAASARRRSGPADLIADQLRHIRCAKHQRQIIRWHVFNHRLLEFVGYGECRDGLQVPHAPLGVAPAQILIELCVACGSMPAFAAERAIEIRMPPAGSRPAAPRTSPTAARHGAIWIMLMQRMASAVVTGHSADAASSVTAGRTLGSASCDVQASILARAAGSGWLG